MAYSQVLLDFSGCPNVHFCPPGPTTKYVFFTPTSVMVMTDFNGNATFWLEAGGICTAGIQISASIQHSLPPGVLLTDGIVHALVTFAGLDQDGDLWVTPLDAAILAAKGPDDPTADLNSDGIHDAADDALLAAHLGHVGSAATTSVDGPGSIGHGVQLGPPVPNPATGVVSYDITLPRAMHVRVALFDLAGRRVRTLMDEDRPAGLQHLHWDSVRGGSLLPGGVYSLGLEANGLRQVRRFVLIR